MDTKSFKESKTRENLIKAFAGESMARNRYCMFAKKAREEDLLQIEKTFQNTALNEKEHAKIFYKFLDGDDVIIKEASYPSCIGATKENLMCAAKYEEEEHSVLYPEFGKIAEEEGYKEIAKAFFNIADIEKHHSQRYFKLYERLEAETLYKKDKKVHWVCTECGHTLYDESAPNKCPVCEHSRGHFEVMCDCL